jgi:hypothetical protein
MRFEGGRSFHTGDVSLFITANGGNFAVRGIVDQVSLTVT